MPGFLADNPPCCPQGTAGKNRTIVGAVGEFNGLEILREHHLVVPDNIPAADHMNPNLVAPLHHTFAPVQLVPCPHFFIEDLQYRLCRAAWRILLVPVVCFDNLDIIILEKFSRIAYKSARRY